MFSGIVVSAMSRSEAAAISQMPGSIDGLASFGEGCHLGLTAMASISKSSSGRTIPATMVERAGYGGAK